MVEGRGSDATASTAGTRASTGLGVGGRDVEELVAVLHATPYHEWPRLRLDDLSSCPVFEEASGRVRDAWSGDEVRAQFRRALTAAATEVILAMPSTGGVSSQLEQHLQRAVEALQAARELSAHPALGRGKASRARSSASRSACPSAVAC